MRRWKNPARPGAWTAAAWRAVLEHTDRPAGLALTRQNVPVFSRGEEGFSDTSNVHRGGYVLLEAPDLDGDGGAPDVILVGTGSEVQVAVAARELLAADGIRARVVSMPCREWFDRQDESYRTTVLAFPLFTAGIICGAIWAEAAWGRFWGWDPKETVAFVSWVVYAAYLHARATAGWRGRGAAWINVVGFALNVFNLFFINLVTTGLHSYAGL